MSSDGDPFGLPADVAIDRLLAFLYDTNAILAGAADELTKFDDRLAIADLDIRVTEVEKRLDADADLDGGFLATLVINIIVGAASSGLATFLTSAIATRVALRRIAVTPGSIAKTAASAAEETAKEWLSSGARAAGSTAIRTAVNDPLKHLLDELRDPKTAKLRKASRLSPTRLGHRLAFQCGRDEHDFAWAARALSAATAQGEKPRWAEIVELALSIETQMAMGGADARIASPGSATESPLVPNVAAAALKGLVPMPVQPPMPPLAEASYRPGLLGAYLRGGRLRGDHGGELGRRLGQSLAQSAVAQSLSPGYLAVPDDGYYAKHGWVTTHETSRGDSFSVYEPGPNGPGYTVKDKNRSRRPIEDRLIVLHPARQLIRVLSAHPFYEYTYLGAARKEVEVNFEPPRRDGSVRWRGRGGDFLDGYVEERATHLMLTALYGDYRKQVLRDVGKAFRELVLGPSRP